MVAPSTRYLVTERWETADGYQGTLAMKRRRPRRHHASAASRLERQAPTRRLGSTAERVERPCLERHRSLARHGLRELELAPRKEATNVDDPLGAVDVARLEGNPPAGRSPVAAANRIIGP